MSAEMAVDESELPGDPADVLAVYLCGVELVPAAWYAAGGRVMLRTTIRVPAPRRGEDAGRGTPVGRPLPGRAGVTALVRRPGGTDVVDARRVWQA